MRDSSSNTRGAPAVPFPSSSSNNSTPSWFANKTLVLLALWLIPVVLLLMKSFHNVSHYHQFLASTEKYDSLDSSASLWMPTNRTNLKASRSNKMSKTKITPSMTRRPPNIPQEKNTKPPNTTSELANARPNQLHSSATKTSQLTIANNVNQTKATKDWLYDFKKNNISFGDFTTGKNIPPSNSLSDKNVKSSQLDEKDTTNHTTTLSATTRLDGHNVLKKGTKDYSNSSIYWRYDQAAPPMQAAKTHQLSSIPVKHRLNSLAFENITQYSLDPNNQYPKKLHLIETNPSVTILPKRYQIPLLLGDTTRPTTTKTPLYLASYRVTHHNNCFLEQERLQIFGGGDWNKLKKIPRTDYLGLALLGEDLEIIADAVVLLTESHPLVEISYRDYSDYRLFTLHEELYFSTSTVIGRLRLGFDNETSLAMPKSEKDTYFKLAHYNTETNPKFQVFLHRKPSCPVYKNSKNLLYFVDDHNQTMVEHYPKGNPNDVRSVNLTQSCREALIPKRTKKPVKKNTTASPTFLNFHQQRYGGDDYLARNNQTKKPLLIADRGSACCIRMKNPWSNVEYLVGVVHPKTPYPGKGLPAGLGPNIYLSRFFAMETVAPYTIVARTGAFCLGYPHTQEVKGTTSLWNERSLPLIMSEDTFDCPRIHFIMSMVENVVDPSQVVISYGVSDCTSRIVTVNKVDIQAMLWPKPSTG